MENSGPQPSRSKPRITDLELVHWTDEKLSMRGITQGGPRVAKNVETFDQVRSAILEHGPIVIATDRVDLSFFVLSGYFENEIMAVRQSGVNVRRFLVREDEFEFAFGDFRGCIDHHLSNNAANSEIEIKHLLDLAESLGLNPHDPDRDREYSRLEVDLIAALQHYSIARDFIDKESRFHGVFELGFSVGRLFSSAQNLATLEGKALKAEAYKASYKERGRKSRSSERRRERIEHLLLHLEALVAANSGMSRLKPTQVAELAIQDAETERPDIWNQGKGQVESYLTELASAPEYRSRFNAIFFRSS